MIKQLISILALSTLSIAPALAEINRIGEDRYAATDAKGATHYITYVRRDHEGDVQVKVTQNGNTNYFWVSCSSDRISVAGDGYQGWDYVDHRKMEGYYSDVACGRV